MGGQAGRPCAVNRNTTGRADVQSSATPLAKRESPCAVKRSEIEHVVDLTRICSCCLTSLSNVYMTTCIPMNQSNVYMHTDTSVHCIHIYRYISPIYIYIYIYTVAPRYNAPRYYADSDITRSVVDPEFLPPGENVKWARLNVLRIALIILKKH